MANRVCRLAKRPVGMVTRDVFTIEDAAMPEPGPGEFRVKSAVISLDPAMRGWIAEGRSYVKPVGLGDVMRAYSAGVIDASNHPDFKVGDAVSGLLGVQQYAVSDGRGVSRIDPAKAPMERWVGGLGMPGMTAYFGLLEVAEAREGDTVVVSAASGAVGQLVGQIAKLHGCRAIGIAGGPEKCAFVRDELGFDGAIDYKREDVKARLAELCPDRIDVYFENVGGPIGNACFEHMATFGRVAVCGMISAYNATADQPPMGLGPAAFRSVLVNRLRVRGFIVFDFNDQRDEAIEALGTWHAEGKLKMKEDVREGGIDAYPDVLNALYTGDNFGKLVLRI